jgi:ADP-ribosylglycohydrolase
MHDWEFYAANLPTEFEQSMEEGLDIGAYKDVFYSVNCLPNGEIKKKLGDVLFEVVSNAKVREDYPYHEPSDLEQIQLLRKGPEAPMSYDKDTLYGKIYGAWMGRVCGCMLGKSVEGVRTNELVPFLKETGNYPMHRYILRSDLKKCDLSKYGFPFERTVYVDDIDSMPMDDDTNYVVLAQRVIERYGFDFTPFDMSRAWLFYQGKDSYCTAERVAYCNFVKGYAPPQSALYKNPYREWIGAQIRGDYFGYINPGDPKLAAEMAWRDASISHVKNGIYGEMFAAAMLAVAATTSDAEKIILGGLDEIPCTSRLYESVMRVVDTYKSGKPSNECFDMIHKTYDEYTAHGWCHTISNAMIVAASLLYGGGDFGASICMAVETGFDTDCNGATVGSILGMANGIDTISDYWRSPFNDKIHTNIFGSEIAIISDCVALTMEHIAKKEGQ